MSRRNELIGEEDLFGGKGKDDVGVAAAEEAVADGEVDASLHADAEEAQQALRRRYHLRAVIVAAASGGVPMGVDIDGYGGIHRGRRDD